MALANPAPKGPLAITKLVRAEDGTLRTIYVDAKTGKQLSTLNGYTIVNNSNYLDPDTLSQPDPAVETTKNPLTEKTEGDSVKAEKPHGEKEGSSRAGFNNYGPTGKDITDTKVGKMGVGLMGGMGGSIAGGILGGVVGGPLGAMVGGLAGSALGKRAFTEKSPYAKAQKEAKAKNTFPDAPPAPDFPGAPTAPNKDEDGPLAKALTPARDAVRGAIKGVVDGIFGGDVNEENIDSFTVDMAGAPTPTSRPDAPTSRPDNNNTTAALSRPDNPLGGYRESYGPQRPGRPNESLISNIQRSVSNVYGPEATTVGTSGVGAFGAIGRHNTGTALDFDVEVDGVTQTNDVAQQDLAMDFAARNPNAGIGYGPGYMTPGRMHLDVSGLGRQWGAFGKNAYMDPNFSANLDFARATGIGPTPTFGAPTPFGAPSQPAGFVSQDERTSTGNMKNAPDRTTTSGVANVGSRTKEALADSKQARQDRFAGIDMSKASPAQFASLGLTARSPAQISAMAQTIAGELSPASLQALAANDPKAQQELASMVTSMENRAASQKFGTLENALTPDQYNSLSKANMTTTMANYNKYGPTIEKNITDYMTGTLTPTNYDVTSYFNPEKANPTWGNVMTAAQKVGEHKFGVLNGPYDYAPSAAFRAERDRLGLAQTETTRGFTPKSDYSGKNTYSGNMDTPSEKGALGRSDGYGAREGRHSFGSTSSPGVGRSSIGSGGFSGGGSYGNSGTGSGGLAGGRGGSVSAENAGKSSSGRGSRGSGVGQVGGSPTNDGKGGSKSPGGGF